MATKRRKFDLEAEVTALYAKAKARDDFAGATAVLRLMRDLRPSSGTPDAARAARDREHDRILDAMTRDERETAYEHVRQLTELREQVRRRLSGEPEPAAADDAAPVVVEPEPAPEPAEEDRPLAFGEIDATELIEEGVDLSWVPEVGRDE